MAQPPLAVPSNLNRWGAASPFPAEQKGGEAKSLAAFFLCAPFPRIAPASRRLFAFALGYAALLPRPPTPTRHPEASALPLFVIAQVHCALGNPSRRQR